MAIITPTIRITKKPMNSTRIQSVMLNLNTVAVKTPQKAIIKLIIWKALHRLSLYGFIRQVITIKPTTKTLTTLP